MTMEFSGFGITSYAYRAGFQSLAYHPCMHQQIEDTRAAVIAHALKQEEEKAQFMFPQWDKDSSEEEINESLHMLVNGDSDGFEVEEYWTGRADHFALFLRNNHGVLAHKCADCDSWHFDSDSYKYGEKHLCESCYESDYFTCEDCGSVTHNDEGISTHDSRCICDDCYRYNYSTCNHNRCGEVFRDNEGHIINGDFYCHDCAHENFAQCIDCDEWCSIDYMSYTEENAHGDFGYVCECCTANYVYEDGYMVHESRATPETGRIHGYHTVDPLKLSESFSLEKGEKRKTIRGVDRTLYYGVELEVEAKDDVSRRELAEATGESLEDFALLMEDGTIGNDGFEIVSAPATLAYHYARWDEYFDGPAKDSLGFNTANCGMHVNVSRAAFTPFHLGKLIHFINAEENQTVIRKLAHRAPNNYCPTSPGETIRHGKRAFGCKYRALNTCKSSVIEFRMFKSTTNKDGFFQRLESVDSWISFTRQAGIRELNADSYLSFVSRPENRKRWKYLSAFLLKKGLIQPVKKPVTA